MQNQLRKIINLVRKTGDRVIVFDNVKPEDTYVVMDLDEYEKLIAGRNAVRGLTKNELLDKINRDVAIWKSERDYDNLDRFDIMESSADDEDYDGLGDDFLTPKQEQKTKKSAGNNWSIPPVRKQAVTDDEETIEEDRQYLEEVPF